MRALLILVVVAGLATGAWYLTREPEQQLGPIPGQPKASATSESVKSATAQPTPRNKVIAVRNPKSTDGTVAYPDGTFLPMLNGVEGSPMHITWPKARPYSPVIRKEWDKRYQGIWVYRHADGSASYTVRLFNDSKQEWENMAVLENPEKSVERAN